MDKIMCRAVGGCEHSVEMCRQVSLQPQTLIHECTHPCTHQCPLDGDTRNSAHMDTQRKPGEWLHPSGRRKPLWSHPRLCHPCCHTLEETLAFSSSTRVHTAGCRATNFQSLHTSAARSRVLVSK